MTVPPAAPGADAFEEPRAALEGALYEMKRVIVGQDAMLERLLVALLAQGHVLLEGVPGLAKTLTVSTLAGVLGGSFRRVQFTPDLVPADLVGTRVFRPDTGSFDIELGPVFGNFLLADEINRAPAKVQSALLEVMQEQPGDDRRPDLPGAAAVPRPRDAEPDRVRGHLPAARGAGRPLPAQAARRLPEHGRGGRRRRPLAAAAWPRCASASRSPTSSASRSVVARRPRRPRRRSPTRSQLADATRHPGRHGLAELEPLHRVRRQPARADRPRARRARARAAARPPARDARGRPRPRARRPAPPPRPLLRRAGRRRDDRGPARRDARRGRQARPWAASATIASHRGCAVAAQRRTMLAAARPAGPRPACRRRRSRRSTSRSRAAPRAAARRAPRGRASAQGTELAQLRPYQVGDDVRQIDAVGDRAHRRSRTCALQVPERALTTWLVLDLSPSMAFGTATG